MREGAVPTVARQHFELQTRRRRKWLVHTTHALYFAGAAVAVLAFGLQDAALLSIATMLLAFAFVAGDVARGDQRHLTPITLFAIGTALTGFADAVGLAAADSPERPRYFVYAVDRHLWIAVKLFFVGSLCSIIGFRTVARSAAWQAVLDVLPHVRLYVSDRALLRTGASLAIAIILLRTVAIVPELGTLTGLLYLIPSLAVFTLARAGARRDLASLRYAALGLALLESLRALWFSYLRVDIVMPVAAFVFGILFGARSLRPARSLLFVPVYVFLIGFVYYFGRFGAARTMGGLERVHVVYGMEELEFQPESARRQQTLLSRITSFNQLSQIGYLVERDGYRNGQTLDYLGYAFVPRFLWPEKPLIAKGAWFALEIGQAYTRPDGSITNAVAMTIPGELYLNFGWAGVLLGCLIHGAVFAVFWTRARFWEEPGNAFGSAFGFYLLWYAFGLGADLQLIVTTLAMYLLFVGASFARGMIARRPASESPVLSGWLA